jgi:hypothetical protein
MCDWEGCTTGTIGLPNPNRRSVGKTSGLLHPYISRYTARVPRDRFLAFEGEGMTWMRQPSWQGIALFSVRMEFWRSTGFLDYSRFGTARIETKRLVQGI